MNLGDDPLHGWLNQPIPEKLWHYTSVRGFQGIVESGNIFATDVRFLNDSAEFIHARKVANDLVEKTPEFGDLQFPLRDSLKWVVNAAFESDFLNPNRAQIFVASFSDSRDNLSQWRGYSHGTSGVSIAFDLRMLRPPIEYGSAITFAPCIYNDDEKRDLIQRSLQHFVKESQTKWTDTIGASLPALFKQDETLSSQSMKLANAGFESPEFLERLRSGLVRAIGDIHRLSGLLKHHAFHHEREWRLVLPISPNKDKTNLIHPIRFRSTTASIIPYIEFPLGMFWISQGPGAPPTPVIPVNDVLLGPGASDDAANAALALLESKSIKIVPGRSDVPYRQV